MTGEGAAAPFDALDFEARAVAMQRVFDDGEPEARAAGLARAARIDAVEALGEPRHVLGGDAGPVSRTEKCPPSSSVHQRICMLPSAGVYFAALSTRFENADCTIGFVADAARPRIRSLTSTWRGCTGRASTSLRSSGRHRRRRRSAAPLIGPSFASKRDSSSRSSMMRVMRSVWRRISAIGRRELAEARVGAEGLEIARDHGERRAQLVRGVGDEILAHLLEAHLARDVAQHEQALVLAVGDELEREVALDGRVDAHDRPACEYCPPRR